MEEFEIEFEFIETSFLIRLVIRGTCLRLVRISFKRLLRVV